jgi:hypothetical protein
MGISDHAAAATRENDRYTWSMLLNRESQNAPPALSDNQFKPIGTFCEMQLKCQIMHWGNLWLD